MADMMGMMLRGMGVDPELLMGHAKNLGAAFERMAAQQDELAGAIARLQAGQDAIAAALGISVPLPAGEVLAIIAKGSAAFVDPPAQPALEPAGA